MMRSIIYTACNLCTAVTFLIISTAIVFAQSAGTVSTDSAPAVGQIVFVQGSVEIVRSGETLSTVAIGDPVNDLDQVRTGDDGQIQIQTNPDSGAGATITVSPDTTFTFNMNDVSAPNVHALDLMDGSLAMEVSKLVSGQVMNVDTGTAVMGIRGTVLNVAAESTGDVLLTVSEGKVDCTTDDGNTLYAEPGTIVQDVNESWGNQNVPAAQLATFREDWRARRLAYFEAHAPVILQRMSTRYRNQRVLFDTEYNRLMHNRLLIDRMLRAENSGNLTTAEFDRIHRIIGRQLALVHRRLLQFEHIFFRTRRVERLTSSGTVKLSDPAAVAEANALFSEVDTDRQTYAEKIRQVRQLLVAERRHLRAATLQNRGN